MVRVMIISVAAPGCFHCGGGSYGEVKICLHELRPGAGFGSTDAVEGSRRSALDGERPRWELFSTLCLWEPFIIYLLLLLCGIACYGSDGHVIMGTIPGCSGIARILGMGIGYCNSIERQGRKWFQVGASHGL